MTLAVIAKNNSTMATAATIQELFNSFICYLDIMPATARTYSAGIKAFFNHLQAQGLAKPDRQSVIDFKKAMLEAGKTPGTVATYLQAVKSFSCWLCNNGLFNVDFARKIKAPKSSELYKKDPLTAPQLKAVIGAVKGNSEEQALRDKAIVTLIASCGLRTIEVSRANVDDIRQKKGHFVLFVQGKGRSEKDRFVPLPKAALNAINNYLQTRGKVAQNAPLFCSISTNGTAGKALSTRTISGICKAALVEAGYNSRRITAHSLRHSVATACLDAGRSIHEVQMYLRHSDINTTMLYAHEVKLEHNPCAETMQGLLFQ